MGSLLASTGAKDGFVHLSVNNWDWIMFGLLLVSLMGLDLFLHRGHDTPQRRKIVKETLCWVAVALAFGAWIWFRFGGAAAGEYYSGWAIEKSLSVDNVFVWALLLGPASFAVPLKYQHKVLFWGVFGAIIMRFLFVGAGTTLLEKFWPSVLFMGAFLLWTGVKVFKHSEDKPSEGESSVIRLVRKVVPVSDELDGAKFFTKINGKRVATPLVAALIVVELTDVVFAVDSVPAILAVSREPYLVLTSNLFAILGLRSLYFLLAEAKDKLHYLPKALGVVLVFVGAKMSIGHWYHVNTSLSLLVIALILTTAIIASLRRNTEQVSIDA